MAKLTLGCDPEFFLVRAGNYTRVSAHDIVPGTKKAPHKLPNGGSVQADGTAVEFNTEPASNGKEFADNISSCISDIRNMISRDYTFMFHPVVRYPDRTFEKIPDNAKELGCDPDYDAYTLAANPRPSPPEPGMRTGAGHLHLGWLKDVGDVHAREHLQECAFMVKRLDQTLYQRAWDWSRGPDEELRRRVYGAPGSFRPKSFGVEYRPLSNSWLNLGRAGWVELYEFVDDVFQSAVDPARMRMKYGFKTRANPSPFYVG